MPRKSRLLRFPPSTDRILTGYAEENDLTINEAAVVAVGLLKVRPPKDRAAVSRRNWHGDKISGDGNGDDRTGVPGGVSAGQDTRAAGESNPLPAPSSEPEVQVRCTHPRPWRKKLGYLTLCDPEQGGCGRPVTP